MRILFPGFCKLLNIWCCLLHVFLCQTLIYFQRFCADLEVTSWSPGFLFRRVWTHGPAASRAPLTGSSLAQICVCLYIYIYVNHEAIHTHTPIYRSHYQSSKIIKIYIDLRYTRDEDEEEYYYDVLKWSDHQKVERPPNATSTAINRCICCRNESTYTFFHFHIT